MREDMEQLAKLWSEMDGASVQFVHANGHVAGKWKATVQVGRTHMGIAMDQVVGTIDFGVIPVPMKDLESARAWALARYIAKMDRDRAAQFMARVKDYEPSELIEDCRAVFKTLKEQNKVHSSYYRNT